MDTPRIIAVKSEVQTFDYEESNNIDFEFNVKVENIESQILEGDWCIQNELLFQCDRDIFSEQCDEQLIKEECERCFHLFDDSNALYMHNVYHLEISLSDIKHQMIMNDKTKEREPLYQCEICDKILPYRLRLRHRKTTHIQDVFTCKVCKSTFVLRRYFKRHMRYVHGQDKTKRILKPVNPEDKVSCDICSAAFKNKMLLRIHIKNCHSQSAVCHICNSTLKSKTYLNAHMKRVHYNDGQEHRCDICNKNFRSTRYMRIHKKNAHSRPRPKKTVI